MPHPCSFSIQKTVPPSRIRRNVHILLLPETEFHADSCYGPILPDFYFSRPSSGMEPFYSRPLSIRHAQDCMAPIKAACCRYPRISLTGGIFSSSIAVKTAGTAQTHPGHRKNIRSFRDEYELLFHQKAFRRIGKISGPHHGKAVQSCTCLAF